MVELIDKGTHFQCVIRSEIDAWDLLRLVTSDDFEDKAVLPEFVGWPTLKIKYWRDGGQRKLTAPMMEGLLDIQEAIYRAFLLLEEDTSNLRHLSEYYREKHEIAFKINSGSTEADPNWPSVAKDFVATVSSKISGTQATVIILVAMLGFGGYSAWSVYLDHKAEMAQQESSNKQVVDLLEANKLADEADLKRMEFFSQIIARYDTAEAISEASDDAKEGVIRSAKRVDSTEVAGIEIQPEAARRMSRIPKAESKAENISGDFVILRNDTTVDEGFRVRLRNLETEEEFFATLRDRTVAPEDRDIIAAAEWNKEPISAVVAITRRRGAIIRAQIVSAQRVGG